jgi:protoporphyrin/coproporphyrin ferrochelatase
LKEAAKKSKNNFNIIEISSWPTEELYIKALAEKISAGLAAIKNQDNIQLIYSAHSLPVSFIEEGDPYLDELKTTIEAIEKITNTKGHLCFQSRSGPVEWLVPSTPDTIRKLADQGCRSLLVLPISFVSDHVETLYEIDIQYHELAQELGIKLYRTESLNITPDFISSLKNSVLSHISIK